MDEIKAFLLLAAVAVRLYLDHGDVRFLLLGLFGLVALASGIAPHDVHAPPGDRSTEAGRRDSPFEGDAFEARRRAVERVAKFVIHYPSVHPVRRPSRGI